MDSQNQLAKQYRGFLDTPSIFYESKNFELFIFSEKKDLGIKKLKRKSISENLVFGKRIELFFYNYIKNSKTYDLLAANIQVIENKVTLGELDFLIKDKIKNQFLHIELVYKFYLYNPEIEGNLQRWIGPNKQDTLLYKINKIKNKQLPLLQKTASQPYLKILNLSASKCVQQVCFLGKLYVPLDLYGIPFSEINKKCIVGFWLTLEVFESQHVKNEVYNLPKKENWLLEPEENTDWISFNESILSIKESLQNNKSLLCWKKTLENRYEQFFVVWW